MVREKPRGALSAFFRLYRARESFKIVKFGRRNVIPLHFGDGVAVGFWLLWKGHAKYLRLNKPPHIFMESVVAEASARLYEQAGINYKSYR